LPQEHGGGEGPNRHQRLGMLLREVEGHSGAWPGRAGGRDGARLLLGILFLQGAASVVAHMPPVAPSDRGQIGAQQAITHVPWFPVTCFGRTKTPGELRSANKNGAAFTGL